LDKFVPGKPDFAAKFLGRIYLLASESYRTQFTANPNKWLAHAPRPKERRIILLGPPMSGKSIVAKHLEEVYGWTVIDTEAELRAAMANKDSKVGQGILKEIRKGGAVSANTVISVVTAKVSGQSHYILDSMLLDPAYVSGLLQGGSMNVDMIVCLQDDSGGEELSTRNAKSLRANAHGYSALDVATAKFSVDLEAFSAALVEAGAPPPPKDGEEAPSEPLPNKAPPIYKVSCNGSVDSVVARVRRVIDVFLYDAMPGDAGEVAETTEADPTRWGDSGKLCIVALKEGKVRHGLDDFAAKYRGRFYKLSSEEYYQAFLAAPEVYVGHDYSTKMPVPRVLIVGPPHSGKKSVAQRLSESSGVPILSLHEIINIFDHGTLAVNNLTLINELTGRLTREPYKSKGCIILGLPYLQVEKVLNEETGEEESTEPRDPTEQMMQLLEAGHWVDAVLNLTLKDEDAISRLFVPPTDEELEAKRLASMEDPKEDDEKTEEEIDATIEEMRVTETEERKAAIAEANAASAGQIEAMCGVLAEKAIPVIAIDAAPRIAKVVRHIEQKLQPYLYDRTLLLYQAVLAPAGE